MNDSDENIIALKTKISKLISLYETCKKENSELLEEKLGLNDKLAEKDLKIDKLEQQYTNVKIAGSFSESTEAKKKINNIVREIDKCIALLNK